MRAVIWCKVQLDGDFTAFDQPTDELPTPVRALHMGHINQVGVVAPALDVHDLSKVRECAPIVLDRVFRGVTDTRIRRHLSRYLHAVRDHHSTESAAESVHE